MSTVEARPGLRPSAAEPQWEAGPGGLHGARSTGWWGMVLLIVTEAILFTILLTTYWYIRFLHGPQWPPSPHPKPDLFLVLIMTPILLLSSAPMHWAELGIRRDRNWQLKLGMMLTFAMGATFLALQYLEYRHILTEEFTPRTDVYGTLFFSITGFHGIHVVVGLLLNAWTQFFAWRGAFTARRFGPVENVVMYWHFVDAVWVFILVSLYLTPHVWP